MRWVAMSEALGRKYWAIPEGYIPAESVDPNDAALLSHEAACLLNASASDANIEITVFFEDREPAGPYKILLPSKRTKHLRFNDLTDPEAIPLATPYASIIRSDVPIIVQHTRLDSRNPSIALLSTIAFPLD